MVFRPFASLQRSAEVAEISASQLVAGEETPTTAPSVKRKLYAEDFPGVTITPVYPGAKHGRHPITKQFVSLKPKPGAVEIPPKHTEDKPAEVFCETPQNPPQTTASDEPTGTTEPTVGNGAAEPEKPTEPAPDFSDIGSEAGSHQDQPPRDTVDERSAHRTFIEFIFDAIVSLLAALFGEEWFPKSAQERSAVVEAWVNALVWLGTRVLNPLQLAYAATASYCFTRLGTLWRWWVNRRMKKATVEQEETVKPEPEKPKTEFVRKDSEE